MMPDPTNETAPITEAELDEWEAVYRWSSDPFHMWHLPRLIQEAREAVRLRAENERLRAEIIVKSGQYCEGGE